GHTGCQRGGPGIELRYFRRGLPVRLDDAEPAPLRRAARGPRQHPRTGTYRRDQTGARRGAPADRPGAARRRGALDGGDCGAGGGMEREAGEARRARGAIAQTSRSTLAEIRRLLGVLREDQGASYLPAPGLADLHRLVRDVASAGLHAEVHVEGTTTELPPG